jgi:hypothetical protein
MNEMVEFFQFIALFFLAPYAFAALAAAALALVVLVWVGAKSAWRWLTRPFF